MLFYFAQFYTFYRICLEHASDQILAVGRDFRWHPVVTLFNLHKKYCQLLIVKRQNATDHGIKNDACAPDVNFLTAVRLSWDDFGSRIVRRTAGCSKSHAILCGVGETKVNQLYVEVFVEKQVFRLQITMNHFMKVRVLDGWYNLLENSPRFIFGKLIE